MGDIPLSSPPMGVSGRRANDAPWIEPLAATVLFVFALFINRREEWPFFWAVDLVACTGAALSGRLPRTGATLTAISLAVWLPFPGALASISGMAFYINIFSAARTNLSWKVPMTLGFGALAYLTLVRNYVDESYRWSTSMMLLIALALAWGGGTALRYAARGIQKERETSKERLQNLQVALARELHDSVAQTLSSAAMRANIAMMDPGISEVSHDQLEKLADECRSSAHDLRQLLSSLRDQPDRDVIPGPLADVETLRHSVEAQAERLREQGFTVDVALDLTKLSAARCQTLAAVTIEAANNIVKHARPRSRCAFSIVADDEAVVGEFTNVMKTTRSAARQGFGLTGIQERLTLLDGTCLVFRHGGKWTLQARLPFGTEGNQLSASTPETLLTGGTTA